MLEGTLGKEYADNQVICRQGEPGDSMFVVQSGTAVAVRDDGDTEVVVGVLRAGDVFGEMAIFDRQPRSATVRAQGNAHILTLDRRAFLRRVHEDPSLAFRVLERMSARIRSLNDEVSRLSRAGAASGIKKARTED
ncbi:MAG TPA: cyclic nucleotide-binding domain-containing protein [Thermoleophilia bacterium]|nr:cyclic nucleotide-binding domain-containing protein [Thermoleophilia bacterium]